MIKKTFVFLILVQFISCSNSNLKKEIIELKKENDSLKLLTKRLERKFIDNSFLLYKSSNDEILGVMAQYEGNLPEYNLIRKRESKIDTIIKNGTKPFIYFKDSENSYNDSLNKFELNFKEQRATFHGMKIN